MRRYRRKLREMETELSGSQERLGEGEAGMKKRLDVREKSGSTR